MDESEFGPVDIRAYLGDMEIARCLETEAEHLEWHAESDRRNSGIGQLVRTLAEAHDRPLMVETAQTENPFRALENEATKADIQQMRLIMTMGNITVYRSQHPTQSDILRKN